MPEMQTCILFGRDARDIVCQGIDCSRIRAVQSASVRKKAENMDLGLKGKTVLVTGASQGIGEGVARGFAAEGCHLHLVARSEDRLKAIKSDIEKFCGTRVVVHALDLTAPGVVDPLIA